MYPNFIIILKKKFLILSCTPHLAQLIPKKKTYFLNENRLL